MEWILAFVIGLIFASGQGEFTIGLLLGGVVGWLLGRVITLEGRLRRLELRKDRPEKADAARRATASPAAMPKQPSYERKAVSVEKPQEESPGTPVTESPRPTTPPATPAPNHSSRSSTAQWPGQADYDWRRNPVIRWLLSGNVPVKVGVLVSFFGVAFLLKYAVDEGWMSLPVEMRLFGVAVFGAVLLGLGWRLRDGHRVYALSIQGGGIGILYLTAYSALRLFDVMPASIAFGLMVLIAAGAGYLAIRQDARALAVLGSVGGFLAPLLASTGTGSHVALFSYYLLLNVGIAGVAWFRHWRMLNLIGFTFTFAVGLVWGAEYYDGRYFASVEPFLIAHFLLYTAVSILSALRQPFRLRGYVDSALVFGLPLVVFPLQAALVDGDTQPLAWSATVLAAFYGVLAYGVTRQWGQALGLLSQVYVALSVIFATLAVPLWLDGPWVSNTWALEAAAMIAIGLKQRRELTHWAGALLLLGATATFLAGAPAFGTATPVLNERFLGGLVLCLSFSFCAWIYPRDGRDIISDIPLHWIAAATAWAGWLVLAHAEILDHVAGSSEPIASMAAILSLTLLLERFAARWADYARVLAVSVLPLAVAYLAWWLDTYPHFLTPWGLLTWPAAMALLAWVTDSQPEQRRWLLPAGIWFVALWLSIEVDYLVNQLHGGVGSDWDHAAELLTLFAYVVGVSHLLRWRYEAEQAELPALMPLIALLTLYLVVWNANSAGHFDPIPFVPVLNLQFLIGGLAIFMLYRFGPRLLPAWPWYRIIAAIGFYLVTMEIARNAHHLGGVPFDGEALWRSGLFQAALAVVWSILGIAGMLLGTRKSHRILWITGAGLMAVVVIKLFLVDLGNSGSLTRVISFIAVGLLLLVVGYFAPAPTIKDRTAGDAG